MRNSEHPAYHGVAQKLRRFGSILDDFEQPLKDDGFDYAEARQWWSQESQNLAALETAAKPDPGKLSQLRSEEQRVEAALFPRMDRLVKFLQGHAPDDRPLVPYLVYMSLWHQCYGEPIRPLTEEDRKPPEKPEPVVIAPTIYGLPYERLEAARLRLQEMKLPGKDLVHFALFLCGLFYAAAYLNRHRHSPTHEFDDGLAEAARQSLESAVDFANDPELIKLVDEAGSEEMPKPFTHMFLGLTRAQHCREPAVYEWLYRDSFVRDHTSLLFAMGVRALHDLYAYNFLSRGLADPNVVFSFLPRDCSLLIVGFTLESDSP